MSCTSRNTVKKHIKIWNDLKMSYQSFQQSSDATLAKLFCVAAQRKAVNPRREELETRLPAICRELGKKGMTTLKQRKKYIAGQSSGYGLTQFRIPVQRYRTISNPSMRMEHKAGDKLFIDCFGDKLRIYPPGESPCPVEVLVSIPGYSLLTCVEATVSQSQEDLITACERAFYYFGVVPQAIVPDNLKSAVSKPGRYEAVINGEAGKAQQPDTDLPQVLAKRLLSSSRAQIELPEETAPIPGHENIRGRACYK